MVPGSARRCDAFGARSAINHGNVRAALAGTSLADHCRHAAKLDDALAPLGERAVTTLLADLALLAPSLQVVATERAAV
jgi:hypothetical protein